MFNRLQQAVQDSTQNFEVNISNQIEELERQLAELREQQAANKERQQRQFTLVGALQSALGQVVKAAALTEQANEQEILAAFWEEVDAIKSGDYGDIDVKALPDDGSPNPSNDGSGGAEAGVEDDVVAISSLEDIKNAKLTDLKNWVVAHKDLDECRAYGSLRSRLTWDQIAIDILDDMEKLEDVEPPVDAEPQVISVSTVEVVVDDGGDDNDIGNESDDDGKFQKSTATKNDKVTTSR